MNTAILEILFLLSVSCLIGIFFTYRYWKAIVDGFKDQLLQTQELLKTAKAELVVLKEVKQDLAKAESQLEALQSEKTELNGQIAKGKEELNKAKTAANQVKSDLKSEKEKVTALKAELKKAKESAKAKAAKKVSVPKPKTDPQVKVLKEALELKEVEMGEMEREIAALSTELHKGKISYYKQIDGKRYKALTLKIADESVAGKGDGRISKEDAEKIFATISDGTAYTQVEKHTLRYIRENYNWTDGADELFRKKVRSWAAKGHHLV